MKKILKAIALTLVVAAFVFAAGCAQKASTQVIEPADKGQVVVTENDTGKTLDLKNGANFTLNLRENPSTGYAWGLNLSNGLSVLSDVYYQDPIPKGYTGVGGTHSWVIQAVAPGSQQVNGVYKRPGENTTGTEENFTLTVKVA